MIARRSFLGSLAAPFASRAAETAPFVASDVGRLKRVLVHTPGPEVRKGLGIGYGPPRFLGGGVDERAGEEHLAMIALLRKSGAEVLTMESVLDEAVKAARAARQLVPWLRGWAPQLAPLEARLSGASLLGAVDDFVYHTDPDGNFLPLADPAGSIYWTRDSAVMTPRGVAFCHFLNEGRWNESTLVRFAYEWSPALRRYPIVFDAAEEQCTMEGGDITVFDSKTLFAGVGNRTSETAARRLARKLEMDVIAVQMPPGVAPKRGDNTPRTPLHGTFLHFDTVCTFVDRQTAVTLPFFLEKEFTGKDPLTRMIRGLARLPKVNEADMEKMAAVLRDLGRVRRYRAGSGELDPSLGDLKLVDYLKGRGIKVVYVGGDVPSSGLEKHTAERVLFELRRQAANTLAVAPGRVLSYAGSPHTRQALEQAGIAVETFPGSEIMRANGGPHCLTQPLERVE
jgi:arginine deiminase